MINVDQNAAAKSQIHGVPRSSSIIMLQRSKSQIHGVPRSTPIRIVLHSLRCMVYHDQRQSEEYCRVSDAWCTTIIAGQKSIAESHETYCDQRRSKWYSGVSYLWCTWIIVDQKDYTPDESSLLWSAYLYTFFFFFF